METKILIVEDEEKIARFVELELQHEGYTVKKASNGRVGLEMAQNEEFSLMLLDVMLPELNGLEVLRRLRKTSNLPVIMLTARDAVMDKVSGLDSGADDYITKPFAIEELLARIRTALKKRQNSSGPMVTAVVDQTILECRNVILNESRHQVKVNEHEVDLTNREFTLLQVLMENKDIVLSRDTLLEKVCGYDYMGETNVIDVYVRYLRSKIDDAFHIKLITTVRGVGYVIKSEE
jgi:DNA-binding response OmpR family regulator